MDDECNNGGICSMSKRNTLMTDLEKLLTDACVTAYIRLLTIGEYPGRNTEAGQSELATLRDVIAEAQGRSGEEVQNQYEAYARIPEWIRSAKA
jgi:bisphosphoglycerate-independent phosphoglycerate mutase (AlkP superfamily)